ncbi:MAG: hypothetical protein AAGF53_18090 [Pseudomonadota bacterium]
MILPLRILQFDRKTEVQPERRYHLIQKWTVLSALAPESSLNLKTNKYSPGVNWSQKEDIKDDDIALDRRALDGSAKIWSDPKLPQGDFYSGDVVDALAAANVSQYWNFKRCRLVD